MRYESGNIWDYLSPRSYLVVPTNGTVTKTGACVMGRGIAHQAAKRYPALPQLLGYQIKTFGNQVYVFRPLKLFSFPVKHNFYEEADIDLITTSANALQKTVSKISDRVENIYLPRVGCGNGRLSWDLVGPVIEPILTDPRFVIVSYNPL